MNVLVVSDEEEVCRLLQINLTRHGHAALCCNNYEEVEELLTKRELTNVVVMTDACLSAQKNGYEVIERLRAEPEHIGLNGIVLMSSYARENNCVQRSLRRWTDVLFLQKPFDINRVSETVERAVTVYRGEPALV